MSRLGLLLLPLLSIFAGLAASESSVVSYRQTVGPAVTFVPNPTPPVRDSAGTLIVVNWNVHVGNGDVIALIDTISNSEKTNGHDRPEFVLLLQESVRQSPDIPLVTGFKAPGRIARPAGNLEVVTLARKLGWWMYYAPSMRNGDGLGAGAEDRGNAILSSLPLQSVESVDLPFFVQRRVALVATVTDGHQQPRLRVAVTHFDTRAPLTQGWIFGGPSARNNQARQLIAALKKFQTDDLPLVIGGDLNTYMGSQGVLDTMAQIAPHTDCGTQPTHALGMTLDHLFADLPIGWSHQCRRAQNRFSSDHYPLVLSVNVPW
jgi:endonuclease/exonuclease/phosphatase family metal-dependent hydrolase